MLKLGRRGQPVECTCPCCCDFSQVSRDLRIAQWRSAAAIAAHKLTLAETYSEEVDRGEGPLTAATDTDTDLLPSQEVTEFLCSVFLASPAN